MTDDQSTKLMNILNSSTFSEAEQDFWASRLMDLSDQDCENILSLFETFPTEIPWLYKIQQAKEQALAENNTSAWEEIVKEEEEHINTLLNK